MILMKGDFVVPALFNVVEAELEAQESPDCTERSSFDVMLDCECAELLKELFAWVKD